MTTLQQHYLNFQIFPTDLDLIWFLYLKQGRLGMGKLLKLISQLWVYLSILFLFGCIPETQLSVKLIQASPINCAD